MKIVTYNVNGLRSILKKGDLVKLISDIDPDIVCLQETRCPKAFDAKLHFNYSILLESKTRKGYSGVAIYSKTVPESVRTDFKYNEEGRVIALEYPGYWVLNTYTPNSKKDLSRLEYRTKEWEPAIVEYVRNLQLIKPVIFCSDFNVAPEEIDIHNPAANKKTHGFTIEERTAFQHLLRSCDLIDTYRHLHPTKVEYTWFSPFGKAKEKNKGWRIDTILISKALVSKLQKVEINQKYNGSDHFPVLMELR